MKSFILGALVLISSNVLIAQGPRHRSSKVTEPISDRPGLAFGASTVGKGSLMLDAGYFHQRFKQTEKRYKFGESYLVDLKTNKMDYTIDLRYGLSSKVEVGFGTTYMDANKTEGTKEVDYPYTKEVFTQFRFRGRYTFVENWKFLSKVAFIGDFGWVPEGGPFSSSQGIEFMNSAMVVSEITFMPKFTLTTNLGLGKIGRDYKYLIAVANVDYAFTPQFHGFIESKYPQGYNYIYQIFHDVGGYFIINNKLQIDLAVSKGKTMTLDNDVWFVNGGISWRPF
jgi:hypothetical protein